MSPSSPVHEAPQVFWFIKYYEHLGMKHTCAERSGKYGSFTNKLPLVDRKRSRKDGSCMLQNKTGQDS